MKTLQLTETFKAAAKNINGRYMTIIDNYIDKAGLTTLTRVEYDKRERDMVEFDVEGVEFDKTVMVQVGESWYRCKVFFTYEERSEYADYYDFNIVSMQNEKTKEMVKKYI